MASRGSEIMAELLAAGEDATGLPGRLVDACARALPATAVALVLSTEGAPPATLAVTAEAVERVEELQFTLGEGPCVDAVSTGRPVLQPELGRTGPVRWPLFTAGALSAGFRAVFALPLVIGRIRVGGLDLYRGEPGQLSDAELAQALSFADVATALLLHLQAEGWRYRSPWSRTAPRCTRRPG
jgi:GAF domain-containing protein